MDDRGGWVIDRGVCMDDRGMENVCMNHINKLIKNAYEKIIIV